MTTDDRRALLRIPILAAGAALSISITLLVSALHGFLDLRVYRVGTHIWLHHGALYGPMPPVAAGKVLPFTYPPSAAVLMTPLAVVPLWLAELMVTATSIGCLAVTVWVVLSRIRPDLEPRAVAKLTTATVVVLVATEPVRLTLWFGQVNLVLMAAVALDCLTVRPRWPRGLLVGLAAATKLTPAGFILFFLIRKDWKAAATAAATFGSTLLLGLLLWPGETRQYWLHTVTDTNRIGLPDYVGNQSIKGLVIRLGVPHGAATVVWLGISVAVLCVGSALMYRLSKLEQASGAVPPQRATLLSVTALLVNATVLLLVSPVSWTHHWVWVGPALVTATAWIAAHPSFLRLTVAAAFAILFLIGPGLVPNGHHRELGWSWWQYIPGDAYIIAAVGLFALGLIRLKRLSRLDAAAVFGQGYPWPLDSADHPIRQTAGSSNSPTAG